MTIRRAYFETGDLSEFDATAVDGGDLSVETAAARFGVYGAQAVIDDLTGMYARMDEALAGEYWVGCYIKLSNPFTGVDLQNFRLFGFGAAAWEVMLRAYYTTASGWQWYLTRPAGGTTTATALSSFNLGQWYWVETHLKRSSGGAATDGDCHVWVDDVLVHDQNDYDNNPPASTNLSNARITLDNIDVGTAGMVYYDHFVLSNEGRIYRTKRNLLTGVFGGPIR